MSWFLVFYSVLFLKKHCKLLGQNGIKNENVSKFKYGKVKSCRMSFETFPAFRNGQHLHFLSFLWSTSSSELFLIFKVASGYQRKYLRNKLGPKSISCVIGRTLLHLYQSLIIAQIATCFSPYSSCSKPVGAASRNVSLDFMPFVEHKLLACNLVSSWDIFFCKNQRIAITL